MGKMILVYVAGAYSAPTPEGVEENCRRAREVGVQLAAVSPQVFPVIPHKLGGACDMGVSEEGMYEGTLELMRRCDAVFLVHGWKNSKGAVAERRVALQRGIPVIYSVEEMAPLLPYLREKWAS